MLDSFVPFGPCFVEMILAHNFVLCEPSFIDFEPFRGQVWLLPSLTSSDMLLRSACLGMLESSFLN